MRYVSQRSVELHLKNLIKMDIKYLNHPDHAEQAAENVKSYQECLVNPRIKELICEWNELFETAKRIQSEAEKINLHIAEYFRLN